jgi:two-component system response regulator YesN
MLRSMLHSGFPSARISVAAEGATALQKIEAKEPDLIFMDIRMPGKNGISLTGEIKQRNKDVVIVILTNMDTREYREAAFAVGADFFLSKDSVTPEEIRELVGKIITDRKTTYH